MKKIIEMYGNMFKLFNEEKVLIVVDMQNDFVTGSLGTEEAKTIVDAVNQKIQECIADGWSVIFTKDTHFENYLETQEGKNLPVPHCKKGTWGWEIVDGLDTKGHIVVEKKCFGYTLWNKLFKFAKLRQIKLVGVCTGICVLSNAMFLKNEFPEVEVSVDEKCCACVTPESHKTAIDAMKLCQIKVDE